MYKKINFATVFFVFLFLFFSSPVWSLIVKEQNINTAHSNEHEITGLKSLTTDIIAEIKTLKGDVFVGEKGSDKWQKASIGTQIKQDSSVKCEKNSEAIIVWKNGTSVKIPQFTVSTIDESSVNDKTNTENIAMSLTKGKIFARVKKLGVENSSFSIKTPTATAGVRGTEFVMEHNEETNVSNVAVVEGSVEVHAGQIETIVETNLQVAIQENAVSEPVVVPAEVLQEIKTEFSEMAKTVEPAESSAAPSRQEKQSDKQQGKQEQKEEKKTEKEEKQEGGKESKGQGAKESAKQEEKQEQKQEGKTEAKPQEAKPQTTTSAQEKTEQPKTEPTVAPKSSETSQSIPDSTGQAAAAADTATQNAVDSTLQNVIDNVIQQQINDLSVPDLPPMPPTY